MATIGNTFTPAFAGRRPNEPTPAPPGPIVLLDPDEVVVDGRRVAGRLIIAGDIDTLVADWGDGTPREPIDSPWRFEHTYALDAVYEIRAIATSLEGRTSVQGVRVQAYGDPTGGGGPAPDLTYNDIVLADRPVAFWPLNDAPGSDTIVDLSANRNHVPAPAGLTLGVPGLADGETGGAVVEGSSGYFELPGEAVFGIPWPEEIGANSMEIWAQVADPQESQALVALDSYGDYSYVISTYLGNVAFATHLLPGFPATPPHPLPPGLHHLVGVYTGAALALYLDGVVAQAIGGASGTQPLYSVGVIGRRGDAEEAEELSGEVLPTVGRFVKVAFYDYALPAGRVAAHYAAGAGSEAVEPPPDPEEVDG
jgi:hypothetical protein